VSQLPALLRRRHPGPPEHPPEYRGGGRTSGSSWWYALNTGGPLRSPGTSWRNRICRASA